jgi:UDP-4-amino-4,6-dideoxy-N-acetyl-beta-L-altrosamine N-acetyltransferase
MSQIFKLRRMIEKDLDIVLCWRNSDEVRHYMYNNKLIDDKEHKLWFHNSKNNPEIVNLIIEKDTNPIGVISFSNIDNCRGTADWAFYSGNRSIKVLGIIMELAALKFAFEHLHLRKLSAKILSLNSAVVNFHKKFGFNEEGLLKDHYLRNDLYYDIHILAIFKTEWLKIKETLESKFLVKYQIEII